MTFMFAPGIPMMFVFATLYLILNVFGLRYMLAYQCRLPFNYSNEMNKRFIKFCAFMPVIYASFGLWMYSNRQIYDNAVLKKAYANGLQDHSHTVVYTLTTFTPGTPLLLLLVIALFNFIMVATDTKYQKMFSSMPGTLTSKIQALRKPDMDNFYQYILHDS